MFVIINGNFVIFVSVCICICGIKVLEEEIKEQTNIIEEIKILQEEMQQQRNITKQTIYSPYDATTTMNVHNFTYLFFQPCEDDRKRLMHKYSPLPMILTTKNVSRKKWRGAK